MLDMIGFLGVRSLELRLPWRTLTKINIMEDSEGLHNCQADEAVCG